MPPPLHPSGSACGASRWRYGSHWRARSAAARGSAEAFRTRQGGRTDSLGFGPVPATTGDDREPDFSSWWGALGTPSIFGVDPEDQIICFLSIMDDYNGSGTSFGVGFANDNSYNVGPAETTYVLQIYDQAELLYDVSPDPDPNISPFPEQARVTLKITVDCLRVWVDFY